MNSGYYPFKNFILTSCQGSKIKLGRVGNYMFYAFTENHAIPIIGECLTEFTGDHDTYSGKYMDRQIAEGPQHGAVSLKKRIMGEIHSHDLGVWAVAFKGIYYIDTPQYATVWPHGHDDLHHGHEDEQLVSLKAIIDRMVPFPLLDTLRGTMTTKYDSAFASEGQTAEAMTGTKTAASDLGTDYESYADRIFKMYCKLGYFYGANEAVLALYIDRSELQHKPEDNVITRNALAHTIAEIAVRTRGPLEVVSIINLGTVDLKFFVVRKPGEAYGIFVTVPAGQTLSFPRSLFGDISYRYFMVENASLTTNGRFEITFPN